jgi:alpha-L-fucosidase
LAIPTEDQLAWQQLELGVFVHFDILIYDPDWWGRFKAWQRGGAHPGSIPSRAFTPSKLDTDQWLEAIADSGATYAILTTKHCTGFCLWPTEASEYSIATTPYQNGSGDIVAEFVRSCRKYGIKPGLYYSAGTNAHHGVKNKNAKPGAQWTADEDALRLEHNERVLRQCEELFTRYGDLVEIWFDGGVMPVAKGGPDLKPLIESSQPHAILYHGPKDCENLTRDLFNEVGIAPYDCWSSTDFNTNDRRLENASPDGKYWYPAESMVVGRSFFTALAEGWFWRAADDATVHSAEYLFSRYLDSVGRNCNLLINVAPDTDGLIPDREVSVLGDLGKLLSKRFGAPAAITDGSPGELCLEIALDKPRTIDAIQMREEIGNGHAVRGWVVEADFGWSGWIPIADGNCLGNRRTVRIEQLEVQSVRLRITDHVGEPEITEFSLHSFVDLHDE